MQKQIEQNLEKFEEISLFLLKKHTRTVEWEKTQIC